MRNSKDAYEKDIAITLLFKKSLKKWWIILLAGIIFALAAFAFNSMQPAGKSVYTFTRSVMAKYYTYSNDQTTIRQPDVKNLVLIGTSDPVLENAAGKLGNEISPEDLAKKLTVINEEGTYLIHIAAKDSEKETAEKTADAVAEAFAEYVQEQFGMPEPIIISPGSIEKTELSENTVYNPLLAFLAGVVAAFIILAIVIILKDVIASDEDAERRLSVRSLAFSGLAGRKGGYSPEALCNNVRLYCGEHRSIMLTDVKSPEEKRKVIEDLKVALDGNNRNAEVISTGEAFGALSVLKDDEIKDVIGSRLGDNDYLFIDAPSVYESQDALLAGRLSDGVIIVIRKNAVNCKEALRAKTELAGAGCNIIGVVLV